MATIGSDLESVGSATTSSGSTGRRTPLFKEMRGRVPGPLDREVSSSSPTRRASGR